MIIDGKKLSRELIKQVAQEVASLAFRPLLVDVLVGNDPVSASYVRIKKKAAERAGVDFLIKHLPAEVSTEQVILTIQELQKETTLCGLIVQLPLPDSVDVEPVLSSINPQVDVDLLNPQSAKNFYGNRSNLIPPTPGAIWEIIKSLDISSNLKTVVVGYGDLVGKPVVHLLRQKGFEVEVVDSKTNDRQSLFKNAELLITGVGKSGIITGEMLTPGVIVIDAGTSETSGSILGDVDFDSTLSIAKFITPVPGGVGPVTVAKLLQNVLEVARQR
ncbi:MAG: bifunctional 5,10-methylenetetrahydrofolate dehydrogenase/5,10-methenyltetrahydrofolate cyclohydrolase [Candidatus Doudnabacteria bacterium]